MTDSISLKKYRHIFFDLDNTLWDFEKNSSHAMFEAFNLFNLSSKVDFDIFFNTYSKNNHTLWDLYRKKEVGKKELTRLRFQNTFNELSLSGINPEEMNTLYLNVMPKQKILNEGVHELLHYLKSKKYQLYIITNGFREVQHNKLESSGLKPYFNKIFISEEVKTPKPGREIFEYAIKSANAKKIKSIMIGDDWDTDVMGAILYGIDAIHFLNDEKSGFQKNESLKEISGTIYSVGTFQQLKSVF